MNNIEKLISFNDLFKESLEHFNKIKPTILKVFGIIVMGMIALDIFSSIGLNTNISQALYITIQSLFLLVIMILFTGFSASLKKKKPVSLKRVFVRGKKLIIPSIWVSLILLVIQIGGLTLFVVPFIILFIYLIFAKLSVVVDNKKSFEALVYSFDLVRGYWFKVLWKMILICLIISGFALITNIFLMPLLGKGLIFNFIFYIINYLFIAPFSVIIMYHLYENLKTKNRIKKKIDTAKLINMVTIFGSIVTIILSITMLYLV